MGLTIKATKPKQSVDLQLEGITDFYQCQQQQFICTKIRKKLQLIINRITMMS